MWQQTGLLTRVLRSAQVGLATIPWAAIWSRLLCSSPFSVSPSPNPVCICWMLSLCPEIRQATSRCWASSLTWRRPGSLTLCRSLWFESRELLGEGFAHSQHATTFVWELGTFGLVLAHCLLFLLIYIYIWIILHIPSKTLITNISNSEFIINISSESIKAISSLQASCNIKDRHGMTPLMEAAAANYAEAGRLGDLRWTNGIRMVMVPLAQCTIF